ncbi:hypothetical protein OC845_002647 [Tilletia horrida]|nr:hypothetical protein OC845_002647 [Tilletia horrida]
MGGRSNYNPNLSGAASATGANGAMLNGRHWGPSSSRIGAGAGLSGSGLSRGGRSIIAIDDDEDEDEVRIEDRRSSSHNKHGRSHQVSSRPSSSASKHHRSSSRAQSISDDDDDDDDDDVQADYDAHRDRHRHHSSRKSGSSSRADIPAPISRRMIGRTILGADDDEDEEEIQEVRHTRDQASPSPPPVPSRKKSTLPQVDQSALQPFVIQRKEERVSRGLAEIRAKRQAQGQTTSSAAAAAAAASSPAKGTRANIVIPGRSSSFHPASTGSSRPSIGANAGINRSSPSSRPLSKALPSEVGLLYDPKDIQRRSHVGDKDHIVIDDSDDDDAAAASARRPTVGGSARSRPISIDDDDDDANGREDHGGDDEVSRHSHAATSARPRRQDDDNQQDDELFRFVMAEKRKAKKLAEQKEKDARLAVEKQAAEEAARARAEAEAEAAAAAAAAQASTAVNPALWASTAASRTFNFNDFLSSAPSSSITAAATTSSNGNAIQSTSVAAAAVTDLSTVPGTFDFGQGAGSSADILHSFGALSSNGNAVGASGEPGISTAQDDAALLMAMFDSVTAGPTQNSAAATSSLGPDLAAASAGPPMSFDPVTGMASTDAVLSVPTAQPSEEANGHPDDPQQQGQGHGPSSGNGLFEQLDLATIGGAGGFSFGLEENEDGDDVLMTTELPDDEEQIQVSSGASTAGQGSRQASPDLGAADDILDLLGVSAPPADEEMAEISSSRNDQADPGVHQNGEEDEPANRAGLTAKEASASASGSYVGSAAAAASADSQATSAIGHGQNLNETVPETLAPFPTADDDEESPPDRGATTTVPNYGLMLPTGGVAASGGDGESPIGDAEPGMDDSDDGEGDLEVHPVIEQADRSVAPEAQSHEPADVTMATNGHDQDREERQGQSDLEVDYGEDAEYGEEEYEYDIEQEEEEEVFDPSKMTIALNPGFEGSSGAVKDMWDDSELLESWDAGMDEHEVFRAQLGAALAAAQRGASRAEQEQAAAEAMAELQSKLEAKAEEAARQSNALMSRKRKTASSGSSTWLESPLPGSKAAKLAAKEHAAQALRRAQQAAAASQAARARVEATLLQKREAEARKKALREQAAAKQRQQEEADRAAAEEEERERRAAEKARVKANGRRRNSESSDVMAVDSPAGTSTPTHADKTAAKTQGIASPSKPGVASRVPAKATPQVFAVAAPKIKPAVPVVPSGAEEEKQLEKEKELLALGVPAASISGGLIGAALRVTGLGRTAAQPVATSWAHSSQTVAKTPNRLPDSGAGEGADDAAEYQLKKDEVSLAKTIEAMTRAGTEAAVRAYKLDLPNLRDAKEVEAETAATASTSGSGVSCAISKQLAELDQVRVDAVQKLMQAWYWVGHYSKGLNVLNEQSEALKAQASQSASSSSLAGPSQAGPSSKP